MSTATMSIAWQSPPAQLPALGSDVHIWGAQLDLPDRELTALERLLSADERGRAQRFHRPEDRRRFIATHGILRRLLGRYLDEAPERVRIDVGEHGKPHLPEGEAGAEAGANRIQFNLSHAETVAGFAVVAGRQVGIDLESPHRGVRSDAIADRYFPPDEAERLAALSPEERPAAFLRSWVCKEAFAKALGLGLAVLDVHTIGLGPGGPGVARLEGTADAAREVLAGWTLLELPPLHGCPGAVVVEGTGWAPRLWLWQG